MEEIIEIDGFEVLVDYDYEPACRGYRDSTGAQIDPDEPECYLINSATIEEGGEDAMDYLDINEETIIEKLQEKAEEAMEDSRIYAMEMKYGL